MTKPLQPGFGGPDKKLLLEKLPLVVYRSAEGARLVTIKSVTKAFGYDGKSKKWPFDFVQHLNKLTPVDPALIESLSYDVTILEKGRPVQVMMAADFLKFARTISQANKDGFLYMSELKFAKAAETMLTALENLDLAACIDFVSGFDRFKQNHRDLLASRMENFSGYHYPIWIKSLPDDFFEILLAFHNGRWEDLNERSAEYGVLLNDLIFSRIDQELFTTLEISNPKKIYSKTFSIERYRMHPALQAHILEIVELLRTASLDASIFRQLLEKRFPKKREIPLLVPKEKPSEGTVALTENLRIAVSQQAL